MIKCYAIFDSKVGKFLPPLYLQNESTAVRSFAQAVHDPHGRIYAAPGDFTLFELGEYDDDAGRFVNLETPRSIGIGSHYLNYDVRQPDGVRQDELTKLTSAISDLQGSVQRLSENDKARSQYFVDQSSVLQTQFSAIKELLTSKPKKRWF